MAGQLEGVLGVIRRTLDDFIGELIAPLRLEFLKELGSFLGDFSLIGTGDDIDRHGGVLTGERGSRKPQLEMSIMSRKIK